MLSQAYYGMTIQPKPTKPTKWSQVNQASTSTMPTNLPWQIHTVKAYQLTTPSFTKRNQAYQPRQYNQYTIKSLRLSTAMNEYSQLITILILHWLHSHHTLCSNMDKNKTIKNWLRQETTKVSELIFPLLCAS